MDYINVLADIPSCDNLFTPEALKLINEVLGYFRILAPAVLILMVAIDLFSILISKEKQEHVYVSKIAKRIIATLLLFLVPTLVTVLLSLNGVKDVLEVDPLCLKAHGKENSTENIYEMFGLGDGTMSSHTQQSQTGNTETGGNNNTATTFGSCDSSKRCRKTVTIKGRTYDSYLQGDFADVGFSGQNIAVAGCSCVAFVQAASGFNRNLTIFKGATMFSDRTFDGIASALRQEGIPYSSIIYYNSNDYENTANGKERAANVVSQVRAHLNQGKPAIAIIEGAPYAGANPHFITLFGEDEQGRLITGNSRKEVGSLEELVANSLRGGRKGFMLVG